MNLLFFAQTQQPVLTTVNWSNNMATIGNTLPHVGFITKDGTITFTPPPATGDSILIVGQALDGPSGVPQLMSNFTDVERAFGPLVYTSDYPSPDGDIGKIGTFSGNTLIKAAREVIMGGGSNIILCRVGGKVASSSVLAFNSSTIVAGMFPGALYNGATVTYQATAATGTTVTCTQPSIKGGTFSMTFTPLTSFEAICASVNNAPQNATFNLQPGLAAASGNATQTGWYTTGNVTLTLGDTQPTLGTNGTLRDDYAGISKYQLYSDITSPNGLFDQIRGTAANIFFLAGIYADDCVVNPNGAASGTASTTTMLTALGQFCYTESRDNYPMVGMIGISPMRALDNISINTRVTNLTNPSQTAFADPNALKLSMGQFLTSGLPYLDTTLPGGQTVDVGGYVSCFAGPDVIIPDNRLGQYSENPAALYAGMVAALPPQRGATNVSLPNATRLAFRFNKGQRNLLNAGIGFGASYNAQGGGAYVTAYYQSVLPVSPKLVITEDVTCAARTSNFANLQTLRIVQACEDVVDYIASDYLGRPNNTATITALDSQLQRGLDVLAQTGALIGGKGSGYTYRIFSGQNSISSLGAINIVLTLRPAFEIRSITTTVSVTQ